MDDRPVVLGDGVLEILREESIRRRAGTRKLRVGAGVLIAIALLSAGVNFATGHSFDVLTLLPIFVLGTSGLAMGASGRHKLSVKNAALLGDLRAIGGIIEALDCGDPEVVQLAESALVDLLPLVKAEDGVMIDDHQRHVLTAALGTTSNREFFATGVGALRHIGDARSLQALDAWIAVPPARLQEADIARNLAQMASADLRLRLARTQIEALESTSAGSIEEAKRTLSE